MTPAQAASATPAVEDRHPDAPSTGKAAGSILFVGPLPPPVNGMYAVNAQMLDLIGGRAPVIRHDTAPHMARRSLRYSASKLWRIATAGPRILAYRLRGGRTLYASVDDGPGMLGIIAFLAMARLCGLNLFLHHHSFRYIDRTSSLMRLLVGVAGSRAAHIVLCQAMEAPFRARYGHAGAIVVAPNVAEASPQTGVARSDGGYTIGMVSNLTFDKGVREFVELVEAGRAAGLDIGGVLAGPAHDPAVAQFIEAAIGRSAGRLVWLGPVYGAEKERFFARLDAFVFPTRYAAECYPLVVIEALGRGLPVVATDKGCLKSLASVGSIHVVPASAPFVAQALPIVDRLSRTPSEALRKAAMEDSEALQSGAIAARERLLAMLEDSLS